MLCCRPCKGKKKKGDLAEICRVKVVVVGDGQCGKTSLIQRYCSGTLPLAYTPTLFDTNTMDTVVDGRKVQLVIQDTAGQEDLERLRPPFYQNTDVIIICFSLDNTDSLENVQNVWVPEVRRFCDKVPILLVATKADLGLNAAAGQRNTNSCLDTVDRGEGYNSVNSDVFVKKSFSWSTHDCAKGEIFVSTERLVDSKKNESRSLIRNSFHPFKAQTGLGTSGVSNLYGRFYGSTLVEGDSLAHRIGAADYFETSAVLNQGVAAVFQSALSVAVSSKQWKKKYRI